VCIHSVCARCTSLNIHSRLCTQTQTLFTAFNQLKMAVTSSSVPRVASAVDSSPRDCAVTAAAVASSRSSSCTLSLSRAVAQSLAAVASAAAAAEAACSRSSLSDSSYYSICNDFTAHIVHAGRYSTYKSFCEHMLALQSIMITVHAAHNVHNCTVL
jgi:hypothetical protein